MAPSLAKKKKYCSRDCALSDPDGAIRNLNKPRIHVITDVDEVNRLGNCAKCGNNVQVRQRSDTGAWRCCEGERAKNRKLKYGLSEEDTQRLFEKQNMKCAVCGTTTFGGRNRNFHVDHDHKTGKVRGLLCHTCNVGIGALGDTYDGVMRAAEYLRQYE